MKNKKYKCPCCNYFTLEEEPPGTFAICPVCYWEDDAIQFNDPSYEGGANQHSLNQAKKNFAEFGASDKSFVEQVRQPKSNEIK